MAVDGSGSVYGADRANKRISRGTPILHTLIVAFDGNRVNVSWPESASGTLEQSNDLANGNGWTTNGYPITTVNGTNSITVTLTAANRFFRFR